METIAAQTRLPDEIVICDGGSSDNTVDILTQYQPQLPLKLIHLPGANISQGRNAAIAAAAFDVIAVTDAGVRLDSRWLEKLIEPFEADPETRVVAGFFLPDTHTQFEVAMGAAVLPELKDVNPETFDPSSRSVAFRREAWRKCGGYPEWLDFCEDLILDFNLRDLVGKFEFAPEAVAYFRPRSSLGAFWKQYFQYARGDGKANLFLKRHLIRYGTYFVAFPLILAAGIILNPLWWLLLLPGAVYMLVTPYRRLLNQWGNLSAGGKIIAALWVPVIRLFGDIAKLAGYPAGILWRMQNNPPDWRPVHD